MAKNNLRETLERAEHFDRHVHELMVAGLDSEELRILTRLSDRLRHSLTD